MYSLVSYLFMLMKTSIGFRLLGDGDLMIVNGNESHEGKYLCQANNGVGSGKSKLISINVDGKSWASERVIMGPNRFWIRIFILKLKLQTIDDSFTNLETTYLLFFHETEFVYLFLYNDAIVNNNIQFYKFVVSKYSWNHLSSRSIILYWCGLTKRLCGFEF